MTSNIHPTSQELINGPVEFVPLLRARVQIGLPFPPASLSGHHNEHWRNNSGIPTDALYAAYEELGSVWKVGDKFGLSGTSVYARFKRAGLPLNYVAYSAEEDAKLRREYRLALEGGRLDELAADMGRTRSGLFSRAVVLGVTDPTAARRRATAASVEKTKGVPKWTDTPHPRGFAGHKHTQEARLKSRKASNDFWQSLTPSERRKQVEKQLKGALAKNGKIGPISGGNREGASWKAGWREIKGRRIYFRSRWEANYARYLQWLKERGDIIDWEYEPETFWFEKIRRGVRSYRPDFRVHELNGSKPLHEVKGWMDARSKTTLKRMAKYHPQETIILIREKEYKAISRFSALIGEWE